VYLSPQGRPLDHSGVMRLAEETSLVLLCGRYEGIDQRLIDAEVDEEVSIGDIEEVSGGTLPKGFYKYSVTAVLPQGETRLASHRHGAAASNEASLRITWEAIDGALEYRIYGRDAVNFGLLSVVPGNSTSYTDTGASTPDQDKKPDSVVQHFYPALGEVTLNVYYTSRNFYNLGNLK
jgi:hypothetical protein